MPIYEYECGACEHRFERLQSFGDEPISVCPECGQARCRRLIAVPGIVFKGSGWYINDTRQLKQPKNGRDSSGGGDGDRGGSREGSGSEGGDAGSGGKEAGATPAAAEGGRTGRSGESGDGSGGGSSGTAADSSAGGKAAKGAARPASKTPAAG